LKEKGLSETDIAQQMKVSEDKGYGAFSLNTSHTVVQEWQNNLNTMKSAGTFEAIWNKWYPGTDLP